MLCTVHGTHEAADFSELPITLLRVCPEPRTRKKCLFSKFITEAILFIHSLAIAVSLMWKLWDTNIPVTFNVSFRLTWSIFFF